MNAENLLDKIKQDCRYELLSNLHALCHCPDRDLFQVKPVHEIYMESIRDFGAGKNNACMTVALSTDTDELWRFQDRIFEQKQNDFLGTLLRGKKFYALEGHPADNRLYIQEVDWVTDCNFIASRLKMPREWLLLGISKNIKCAQAHMKFIRDCVRTETLPGNN